MRRLIDGPRRDWLSDQQCAAWMGIGLSLFHQLVAAGRFPAPVAVGRGKPQKWHWQDCIAYMHLRGRALSVLALPEEGRGEASSRRRRGEA